MTSPSEQLALTVSRARVAALKKYMATMLTGVSWTLRVGVQAMLYAEEAELAVREEHARGHD